MAINFGVALGRALESGLSTYERLGEEEYRQMQREKMRREMEQEQALETKFAETMGRVGQKDDYGVAIQQASGNQGIDMAQAKAISAQGALQGNTAEDQAFERASAEAAAGAMRENAVRQGKVQDSALPTMIPQEYTSRQGMQDYAKAAAGVSRKGYLEALALKKEMRTSEIDDKFDLAREELNTTLAKIHGTAESGGLKGLADSAKKEGLKVEYVEGKNGVGRINVLGPKGDVLETVNNIADATAKLEKLAMTNFQTTATSLLGSPDKVLTYLNQREELGLKGREVSVKESVAPSEIAKNRGEANYKNSLAAKLGEEKTFRDAAKPYMDEYLQLSEKDRDGKKGAELLDKAEAAVAFKSGDFTKIKANTPLGKLASQWSGIEKKMYENSMPSEQIALEQTKFFANKGYASPAIEAAAVRRIETHLKNNKPQLAQEELNKFNQQFKNTPITMPEGKGSPQPAAPAAPASAIPAATRAPASSKERGFYENKLEQRKKALEVETNPRRKATISNEIASLEAMLAK